MTTRTVRGNYVILSGLYRSEFCILGFIEGFEDDYKLFKGYPLAGDWPRAVSFRMDPDFKKRIKLSDHLVNSNNVIIASKRLREFFESENVPNLEYLPVTIIDHKKRVASNEYCIAHQVTTQDCIDLEKSEVVWSNIIPEDISTVKKLVLDEERIDDKAAVFRARRLVDPIFIRRDLAKKMEEQGFTGFGFGEVSDYKG
jgi:hypothetical protein